MTPQQCFRECAEKSRQYADNYGLGSDGRNTFTLLAEWADERSNEAMRSAASKNRNTLVVKLTEAAMAYGYGDGNLLSVLEAQMELESKMFDRDPALTEYAQRLATVAAKKAGCDENWRPLNDLSGCLLQIDNAMTGLVAKPDFMDSPHGWLIKDEFDADPQAWFFTPHEDQAREYAADGTPVFSLPDSLLVTDSLGGNYKVRP